MINSGYGKCKSGVSLECNGIEKKQSLISTTIEGQLEGRADTKGNPNWTGPMITIWALIALKSCNNRHLPDFFLMIKIGVFHGEVEGFICPATSCSYTNVWAASYFSLGRGH